MPAASALRAEKAIAERSRGAHPCVAQLASSSSRYGTAPAILAESCRMKVCASEPRALSARARECARLFHPGERKRGAPRTPRRRASECAFSPPTHNREPYDTHY